VNRIPSVTFLPPIVATKFIPWRPVVFSVTLAIQMSYVASFADAARSMEAMATAAVPGTFLTPLILSLSTHSRDGLTPFLT
jgi:hypothetical protein